ncbi:MAG: DUF4266 domain-containing protein [Deltaproteobacteria bacterium]|nr:DUF4266 domain-containing protein [Deltaproteobacteria bacterium]
MRWRWLLLTLALLGGCGHVRPWEREGLARIDACLDGDRARKAYEAHLWMVRDGAMGGTGTAGGGCGCN